MTESTSAGVRRVAVDRHSPAPVSAVWPLLADAATWRDWGPFVVSRYEREGEPPPDGVGAIRRLGVPGFTSREKVVVFEPPHHLAYVLLAGLPVRDYRADVTLTPAPGGGTDIAWRSTFRTARAATGWFWQLVIERSLASMATRLAKAAVP
jgi:uncharacterized protein YndB with AHSA1/START domain